MVGGKAVNSELRFSCLVQQPVNRGGLPYQTAAIQMVGGGLGRQTANSVLRFRCLVQQPVNFGGLPLQPAAIDMVGGGLGRQTAQKHGLAPRPPN